jgi:hypothetical protein
MITNGSTRARTPLICLDHFFSFCWSINLFRQLMSSIHPTGPYVCRYQLIRVNASNLGNNCKWLDMFEDVDLILYCVDLTSYNEFHVDNNMNLINKMLESKNIFENIITHPSFKNKQFLLILNKFDLLEKQIITTPLTSTHFQV